MWLFILWLYSLRADPHKQLCLEMVKERKKEGREERKEEKRKEDTDAKYIQYTHILWVMNAHTTAELH